MRIRSSLPLSLALLPIFTVSAGAQVAAPPAAALPTEVPALVAYSGVAVTGEGKLISGDHPATFLIYKDQQGGEPLFTESQMIRFDEAGRYRVQLGASNPSGLPSGLFANGEARWLEVQIAGEIAQPRVLLASVPYALKAADAATLGGLPASAFVLAGSKSSLEADPAGVVANAGSTVTTTGGVSGYLPRFNGASTVVDSKIFDTGTDVGIGTATPTATLDVNGTAIIAGGLNAEGGGNFGGSLNILATGNATASAGKASQPLAFVASAYSSSSKAAVAQIFRWTAEPTGNDTASPSGALELLFSSGSGTPTATGLSINAAGQITFAPGQSLPGADIAGAVNASSYELGGSLFAAGSASTESAYLGFAGNTSSTGVENTGTGYLALNSDTTGTDNTATGALALSNNTTGGYNTATGLLALYGNTTGQYNTASGASTLIQNTDGLYNTASGASALTNNVDGSENTASGASALYQNTDGDGNTAVGVDSLPDNTIGSYNTGVGYEAEAGESMAGPVNNATAIGAHATVNQSNSLILGQTTAAVPGPAM